MKAQNKSVQFAVVSFSSFDVVDEENEERVGGTTERTFLKALAHRSFGCD